MPQIQPQQLRIARTLPLQHVVLLGQKIPVWLEAEGPLNGPVVYEYAAQRGDQLIGIYFGQASNGLGRPTEQYRPILEQLRENRLHGSRMSSGAPKRPYRSNDPWGFRWVHHELERLLGRHPVEITLALRFVPAPQLKAEEDRMIHSWRGDPRLWNECAMPTAVKKGRQLDDDWL